MEKYQINYIKAYWDWPHMCSVCWSPATDIHHIIPRSKFGAKMKEVQDAVSNLIALCRICHMKAHSWELTVEYLISMQPPTN